MSEIDVLKALKMSQIMSHNDETTILLVEQNARMALEYADRGYVFKIGKIAYKNKARNLLENDEMKRKLKSDLPSVAPLR